MLSYLRWTVFVVAPVLLLGACEPRQTAPVTPPPGPVLTPTPSSAPGEQAAPPGATAQILHYDLAAKIDPAQHGLECTAQVRWRAEQATAALDFELRPNLKITRLEVEDQPLRYDRDGEGRVTVKLPAPAAPRREVRLKLVYAGEIKGPRGGRKHQRVWDYIGMPGSYVRFESGWYPQVPGDTATADLRLTVPEGWTAVSVGSLVGQEGSTFHWRTDLPAAGLSFCAAEYVLKQGLAGGVPVQCYTFAAHAKRGAEFVEQCGELLELLQQLYGRYPFPQFAVAEIPDLYGGGHGDQGFIMLQEKAFREAFDGEFVAHEMAHNWWGGLISCVDSEFLAEGFATYTQALWREQQEGTEGLREAMQRQGEAVLLASMEPDREESCYESKDGPLLYEKASWILHMLRRLLGEEKWREAVRDFAQDNAGRAVRTRDFEQAMARAYGQPLDWFFRQWLYGQGVPWVKAEIAPGAGPQGGVRITQRLVVGEQSKEQAAAGETWKTQPSRFRLLVDLTLRRGAREWRQEAWVSAPETRVLVADRPTEVVVDPDGWLLNQSRGLVGELDNDMRKLHEDIERELSRPENW